MNQLHPELLDQTRTPVSGTLLAYGSPGIGRRGLFRAWAARHVGAADSSPHPDIRWLEGADGKPATAEDARAFVADLRMSGERGRRAGLVPNADALGPQASAALLKLAEEPSAGTLLLLTARAPASLPPALLSRASRLRIPAPQKDRALNWLRAAAPQIHETDLAGILVLADGRPGAALSMLPEDPLTIHHQICRLVAPVARGRGAVDPAVLDELSQQTPALALDLLSGLLGRTAMVAAGTAPEAAIKGEDRLLTALAERLGASRCASIWHRIVTIGQQRDRQHLDRGRAFVRAAGCVTPS